MVIGVGLIFILATLVSVVISWFGSLFELSPSMPVLNSLAFLGITTLAFAMIFKIIPEEKITWTNAVVLMAADALYGLTPAANLFDHRFWETALPGGELP